MPIFNLIGNHLFWRRNGVDTSVALKPGVIPDRYEKMTDGYLIMSNVVVDMDSTPYIVESCSSIVCYPSPKINGIVFLEGDDESNDYSFEDVINKNGAHRERWSNFTLPQKIKYTKHYGQFFEDLGEITGWCETTNLPPYWIIHYFNTDRYKLIGLNVELTDEEMEQGNKWLDDVLKSTDHFINSYSTKPGKLLTLSPKKHGLDETQTVCVKSALSSGITIITGGPGTGKTKVSATILNEWEYSRVKWRATALAQHAVNRIRIKELTDPKYNVNFVNLDNIKKEKEYLWITHLLVDEMSMINSFMFESLLKRMPNLTTLILVGDVNQLSPIGRGSPYENMIEMRKHHRLLTNYRMREERYSFIHVDKIPTGAIFLHPYVADATTGSMTIHKAQGSEFDKIVLGTSRKLTDFSKNKKLVYTAVTRSRSSEVYLMGSYSIDIVEKIMYG